MALVEEEVTGSLPNVNSGPVTAAPGEDWAAIDDALRQGHRKLPGGSSLAQLLARKLGARNPADLPDLTEELILAWADAHKKERGLWPRYSDGSDGAAPGETWAEVDYALRCGRRTLTGGSSLAKLLAARRGAPYRRPPIPGGPR
jgi:hypothetical protein